MNGFRLAAGDELGIELDPSVDEESNTAPADTVCYLIADSGSNRNFTPLSTGRTSLL